MNSVPHGSRASIDILEELQLIAAQNLEKLDINKYYEVVRELGKGTYGKVDLVIHKIRGINICTVIYRPNEKNRFVCVYCISNRMYKIKTFINIKRYFLIH